MMVARRRSHVRGVVTEFVGISAIAAAENASPSRIHAPAEVAFSAHSEVLSRQFDFWLGEWDVTRVRPNPDGTAEELGTERVLVYPVLDGCGVIGVLRREGGPEEVFLLTFDVTDRRWFTIVLCAGADAEVYSGTGAWFDLVGEARGELQWLLSSKGADSWAKEGTTLGLFRGNDRLKFRRLVDQERR